MHDHAPDTRPATLHARIRADVEARILSGEWKPGDRLPTETYFTPRLGFSWDVNGDSSFKVYGNAGRYSLPLTATVSVVRSTFDVATAPAVSFVPSSETATTTKMSVLTIAGRRTGSSPK